MLSIGFVIWVVVSLSAICSFSKGLVLTNYNAGVVSELFPILLCSGMYALACFTQRRESIGAEPPTKVRLDKKWQFRDEKEALVYLQNSYAGWQISEEDINQLAFLHFFGWTIAKDCMAPPLKLIRGSESMIFNSHSATPN
jgi:hypothetical protein